MYYLLTYYLYVDVKEPDWLQDEPADVWILEVTPSIQTQNGRFAYQILYEVGVTGFEPVTLRLSSACSNQLSYTPEAGS